MLEGACRGAQVTIESIEKHQVPGQKAFSGEIGPKFYYVHIATEKLARAIVQECPHSRARP